MKNWQNVYFFKTIQTDRLVINRHITEVDILRIFFLFREMLQTDMLQRYLLQEDMLKNRYVSN